MQTKKKERNSSLELLRILCIILIIMHHYHVHGGFPSPGWENFSIPYTFIQIAGLFGRASCAVFALITGFFLISSNGKNHYRKVVTLIAEVVFYSVVIAFILYIFKLVPLTPKDLIKSFFPLFWNINWYILYYILFYFLVPFINPWLRSMNRKQYTLLVMILFIMYSVIPTIINTWLFSELDFFLVLYIIGGYIKLHIYKKVTYKNQYNLLLGLLSMLCMAPITFGLDFGSYMLKSSALVSHLTPIQDIYSVFSLSSAIFIFLYFANLNFTSKFINRISTTVLGIYLIHDNEFLRPYIWEKLSPNIHFMMNPYLHMFLKVSCVFILCILIDLLRQITVGRIFENWFYRNCDNIVAYWKKKAAFILQKMRKDKSESLSEK